MDVIEVTAKKWGSSLGIIIPKDIVEKEHIKEGQKVSVLLRKPVNIEKSAEAWKDMQN